MVNDFPATIVFHLHLRGEALFECASLPPPPPVHLQHFSDLPFFRMSETMEKAVGP